jgi:hypothetical protein
MKKLSIYMMAVLIGAIMFGCKKDETKSSKDNIIGKWMMTGMTVNPAIEGVTDYFSTWSECSKDDLTIFNADGTVTNDEGATKCDDNNPQTSSGGTWALSSDNKTLIMNRDEYVTNVTIVTLTSSKFVGTYVEAHDDVNYTFTVTLVKK